MEYILGLPLLPAFGSAIEVHRELGPGLLESSYEICLIYELQQQGLRVERQKVVSVEYKEIKLGSVALLDNPDFGDFWRCNKG